MAGHDNERVGGVRDRSETVAHTHDAEESP
jgi:hypothetical protein